MELKLEEVKGSQHVDEFLQQILKDIMAGLREKMVQPVLDENRKLAAGLNQFREEERTAVKELQKRLDDLESKIQQVPLVILAAFRDAINQSGGWNRDVR